MPGPSNKKTTLNKKRKAKAKTEPSLTKQEYKQIDDLVEVYNQNKFIFDGHAKALLDMFSDNEQIGPYIHTLKVRQKEPPNLRDKLIRKRIKAKTEGIEWDFNKDNLFNKITDLVGVRLIHLHSDEIRFIHEPLLKLFEERGYTLYEKPFARIWDDDARSFYNGLNIDTQNNDNMYTSVHYVFSANAAIELTLEVQVRTLAEELWGEVDHKLNYPHKTHNELCSQQLRVLARLVSSCSKLVDTIFFAHNEKNSQN